MGGGDMDFPSLTMVLMGRTGNGKSATGNSILGRSVFESEMSFSGVTSTAECQSAMLTDGRLLNVIDTPGLFDFSVGSEIISKEIMKCIELSKDGIHAVLFVLSIGRFSEEEAAAVESLQTFFGPKITDYMIVVFTFGDFFKNDVQFENHISKSPKPLQDLIQMCKNRVVLFDNKTNNEEKKTLQVQKLLSLVDKVTNENGGQPYSNNMFIAFKEAAVLQQLKEEVSASDGHSKEELMEMLEQIQKSNTEQLKQMTEMVEAKLKETNERLQEQLAYEKDSRLKAEKIVEETQRESESNIRNLSEKLAEALKIAGDTKSVADDEIKKLRKDLEDARRMAQDAQNKCAIL